MVGARHEMLREAVDIISGLFDGEPSFNYRGTHFDVESAVLWDLPETRVPIASRSPGVSRAGWPGRRRTS